MFGTRRFFADRVKVEIAHQFARLSIGPEMSVPLRATSRASVVARCLRLDGGYLGHDLRYGSHWIVRIKDRLMHHF